ncbi:hypothetical protein [Metabacillus indicus]|uniref:hypothetical protein n=1 Tax=Metabacillus indicus TaxID=246786 RepID=UPI00049302DB|nr:hypothetical protein [Metabacillus indicus]KEZ51342.1 hypothetical protein AZ46_0212255 [Metabacillus indicus LMG 22858]
MDTVEILSLSISGLSVIVTGFFSFLIFSANKKSAEAAVQSARAAEEATKASVESVKIAKAMMDLQTEQKKQIRNHLKRDVIDQVTFLCLYLEANKSNYSAAKMKMFPEKIFITNQDLGTYFTEEETQAIRDAIMSYKAFRILYYKDGEPHFMVNDSFIKDHDKLLELLSKVLVSLGAEE